MKILFTCKEFPHAKVIGGPIIIYNRLKYFSKNHLVSLAAFFHAGEEKYIPSVKPHQSLTISSGLMVHKKWQIPSQKWCKKTAMILSLANIL